MVLDCSVILHEVHHGAPRTGEAYQEDGLDDGLYGHDDASAVTTLMFNGHDVQQQPHPVVYMAMRIYCPSSLCLHHSILGSFRREQCCFFRVTVQDVHHE